MTVRRLRISDLPQVLRIERTCFRGEGYGVGSFLAHLFRDRKGAFVAEEAGVVAGYALVRLSPAWARPRRGGITSIAVAPAQRRRGIGRLLMEKAVEHLRAHHAELADLEVRTTNAAARSLYESFGFRCAGLLPQYYGRNGDGLRMVLDLRPARQDGR